MYKSLYIILFLFTASGAQAQQLPERSLVRKGNRQYNKGNYEQSAGRYEQALQAAPGQFEAIYNLGNALYKAERFDRAEQTMQQAAADSLRADTERAEAFYNLGNAQFKQQKYQEALESYKQSLRLNPSDMEAKYNYAYTKRLLFPSMCSFAVFKRYSDTFNPSTLWSPIAVFQALLFSTSFGSP